MRVRRLTLLLCCAALLLTGCRITGEVENQAYVLVLGMDRLPDGRLELTARVPQIGKSSAPEKESGGGGYLTFSAAGGDWGAALEALEQVTPRPMLLSHIEMLVASEALAQAPGFGELIARVAETPHLYTTARFAVCDGSARDFIDAQQTVIGTRLSSEINAMLDHYAERGVVPQSTLADAYCLTKSFYADPVAIHASLAKADAPASASLVDPRDASGGDVRAPMRQRYAGAALFRGGRMVGALDAGQARMLGLIRGTARSVPIECDGRSWQLTPNGAPQRCVRLDGDGATLALRLSLNTVDGVCDADAKRLEAVMSNELSDVIRLCQRLGTDPFGFSDSAAARFATVGDWLASDWRSRYANARLDVGVSVRTSGR